MKITTSLCLVTALGAWALSRLVTRCNRDTERSQYRRHRASRLLEWS